MPLPDKELLGILQDITKIDRDSIAMLRRIIAQQTVLTSVVAEHLAAHQGTTAAAILADIEAAQKQLLAQWAADAAAPDAAPSPATTP